jgi:uncharacterized protein (TIGR02145 family)
MTQSKPFVALFARFRRRHGLANCYLAFMLIALFILGLAFTKPWAADAQGADALGLVSPPTISLAADSPNILELDRIANPNPINSTAHTVSVSINTFAGYSLALSVKGANNNLIPTTAGHTAPITPAAGTFTDPAPLTDNTWGYAIDKVAASTPNNTVLNYFDASYTTPIPDPASKWAAVPISDQPDIIKTTTQAAVTNDLTTIYYAAKADISLPADDYEQTVTYLATADPDIVTIPAPAIISITPNRGPAADSTLITIIGANFTKYDQSITTAVTIGNQPCQTVQISSDNPTDGQDTITCVAPPHEFGEVDVVIATWSREAATGKFFYETPYTPPADLTATATWVKAASANTSAINSIAGATANTFTIDLDPNMIPVVNQAADGYFPTNWCNYDSNQWCNAVTVKDDKLAEYQSQPVGAPIPEEDILGYWVYVPRYEYQVCRPNATNSLTLSAGQCQNGNNQDVTNLAAPYLFNIRFQKSDQKSNTWTGADGANGAIGSAPAVGEWATHPAFTFGGQELSGFWYGKFESSRSDGYYCSYAPCNDDGGAAGIGAPLNTSNLYATIKPSQAPAAYQRVSSQYLSAEYIKTAHNIDALTTSMSNNNHWGAAAYLSDSIYGTTKVYNNGYSNSSAGSDTVCAVSGSAAANCRFITGAGPIPNQPDSYGATLNTYETAIGQQASTTGNIYGIYDMAGGVYEYQLAVYANPTGVPMSGYSATDNSGFTVNQAANGNCYKTTGLYYDSCTITDPVAFPAVQAYDVSIFTGSSNGVLSNHDACTWTTCGGQALHETKTKMSGLSYNSSWGADNSAFVTAGYSWFSRGGGADFGAFAGIWGNYDRSGGAVADGGWRAVANTPPPSLQSITSATCPTTETPIVDARDNHTYYIQKIGNLCWMLTNLAYAGGGDDTYGDVIDANDFSVFDGSDTKLASAYNTAQIITGAGGAAFTLSPTKPVTTTGNASDAQRGYLYNWCAAMGGAAKNPNACVADTTQPSNYSATVSVCPANWRLPTGGQDAPAQGDTNTTNEFAKLDIALGGTGQSRYNTNANDLDAAFQTTWLGVYSGNYSDGLTQQAELGYYWSSTANNNQVSDAHGIYFNGSYIISAYTSVRKRGYAVRCVLD